MRTNKRIIVPIVAIFLLITVGLFTLVEIRINAVRGELSNYMARSIASTAITEGLDTALANYKLDYDDIVTFTYDEEGNIKSLKTNIIALNNLGNRIGSYIDEDINGISSHEIKLPITSLLGEELTSGVGPKIPIHITLTSLTSTKFENKFESAGVNQTRHQIFLHVVVTSYVVNGKKVTEVPFTSNVCIAESIIIGVTPSTFASF